MSDTGQTKNAEKVLDGLLPHLFFLDYDPFKVISARMPSSAPSTSCCRMQIKICSGRS